MLVDSNEGDKITTVTFIKKNEIGKKKKKKKKGVGVVICADCVTTEILMGHTDFLAWLISNWSREIFL